jgi:hypothetical protein
MDPKQRALAELTACAGGAVQVAVGCQQQPGIWGGGGITKAKGMQTGQPGVGARDIQRHEKACEREKPP